MYVCIYLCMCVCMHVRVCMYMFVYMYVYIYVGFKPTIYLVHLRSTACYVFVKKFML